ncbi:MAG: response regulator [Nitrosomonadales bacterium]|nr:response regulator [Nitrosomonadales bacterium]
MAQLLDGIRILIVDDSASIRSMLHALLNSEGYEVVGELGSGAKLLATIAQLNPHIVCLDYDLPDADGLSLLKEIHAANPQVAVVMITGSDSHNLEYAAAEAGAAGFIRKPFSQDLVIKGLRQVAYAQKLLMIAARKHNSFEGKPCRAKAVIADDSKSMRQLLAAILAHAGIEVVGEACDGRQAVELVSKHQPDIVCLDLEMPVMSGLEALKIIRSRNPAVNILMITSLSSRDAAMQAASAGARGYILKPFHPDKVTQSISRILAS